MKDKLRDKTKTKAGETRRETRERQDQGGGQSIPDQMGDKLRQDQPGGHSIPDQMGDKVGDKTGGKPSEADTASQSRRTH